jgi:CelD/BcsL family acetyltransferase involved in cellulose biosynthesis
VKALRNHGAGALQLERVDAPAQVPAFLRNAATVARQSWQQQRLGVRIDASRHRQAQLVDLAERGLLRSYLLHCGPEPCAFGLAYQFRGVYHAVETAYAQSFAHFSPGIVLLYLVLEDLMRHQPPRCLYFGIGDAPYKREFGTIQGEDATILLVRKSLARQILLNSHAAFRGCVRSLRDWGAFRIRKLR